MPRNISFMLTSDRIRDRSKTVTRRLKWEKLRDGDELNACLKCMGLKPGEKITRLAKIRVVSVRREPLWCMSSDPEYGKREAVLEGYPHMTGAEFVEMFSRHMKCLPHALVTRIEFEYLD